MTALRPFVPQDAPAVAAVRAAAAPRKGSILGPEARPMFDAARAATPAATGVRTEPGVVGGVPGLWCRPPDAMTGAGLLFLHGGGYMMGSAAAMASFGGQLAIRARADTFVADYRLAPEHPFPAAFDDALSAYRGLAAQGAGAIAVAGESAGGGLALALLPVVARDPGLRQPCAAAVMSPWTDLTLGGSSHRDRAEADPIFTREALAALAARYLQRQQADDPRASPLFADLAGLPPVRIDVGEDEVLLDDARRYAQRALAAGVDVSLSIWAGMFHVFQARLGHLVAARLSMDEAGGFLNGRMSAALAG